MRTKTKRGRRPRRAVDGDCCLLRGLGFRPHPQRAGWWMLREDLAGGVSTVTVMALPTGESSVYATCCGDPPPGEPGRAWMAAKGRAMKVGERLRGG